jgi:hypothetical protein
MTPKEKAVELLIKYDELLTYIESKRKAKDCVLIAVDEIIASNIFEQNHQEYIHPFVADKNGYWREVKQEIEKL